jgi:hypothetical protein
MLVRSSFLGTAQRCIAEAYYRYHLGLIPKGRKQNKDTFFGTAVHKGVEIALNDNVDSAVSYLNDLVWPATNGKKKKANAIVLVRSYSRVFNYQLVGTELDHEIRIGRHIWRGRFDIVAQDARGLVIIDLKTTNPAYLLVKPNTQFSGYYLAAEFLYPDFSRFEIVNLDPDMLEVSTYPFKISDEAKEEWKSELVRFVDYVEECFTTGVLPRSDSQCVRYGRRLCAYHDICISAKNIREKVIQHCYDVSTEQKNLDW